MTVRPREDGRNEKGSGKTSDENIGGGGLVGERLLCAVDRHQIQHSLISPVQW